MVLILLILIVAAVCGVLGFVVKGLLWLGLIALVIFLAAAVFGGLNHRGRRNLD